MAEFVPFQRDGHKANEYLPFGASPHQVLREKMDFDPLRGGWVSKAPAGQWKPPSPPKPVGNAFDSRFVKNNTKHFETRHFGNFRHGLKEEVAAGIIPPDFSTTGAMSNPPPKGKGIVAGYAGHVPHERNYIGGSYRNVQFKSVVREGNAIHSTVDYDGDGKADTFVDPTAGIKHHGYSAYVHESSASFNDDGVGRIDGEDPSLAAAWGGGAEGQFVQVDQDRDGIIDKAGSASVWSKAEQAARGTMV